MKLAIWNKKFKLNETNKTSNLVVIESKCSTKTENLVLFMLSPLFSFPNELFRNWKFEKHVILS